MPHVVPLRHLGRHARASVFAALAITASGSHGRTAMAASPRQQTYIACSNGDSGDDKACQRLCRQFLKQKNDPLGDMRSTCLRRLDPRRNPVTDPD